MSGAITLAKVGGSAAATAARLASAAESTAAVEASISAALVGHANGGRSLAKVRTKARVRVARAWVPGSSREGRNGGGRGCSLGTWATARQRR